MFVPNCRRPDEITTEDTEEHRETPARAGEPDWRFDSVPWNLMSDMLGIEAGLRRNRLSQRFWNPRWGSWMMN
jgi:hypothetical protein